MGRLTRSEKHFGTFTGSKGEKKEAFIAWETKGDRTGFVLRDAETNKVLANTAFETFSEMKNSGINFVLDGTKEDLPQPVAA